MLRRPPRSTLAWSSAASVVKTTQQIQEMLAARSGRPAGDPEMRNITGAIVGVVVSVWFDWAKDPDMDGPAEIDRALAHLAAGLPLDYTPG
ncbi:hypothetical protein [Nonomuraea sp. NPDC059022]|uniref:acyl-CoA-like ligand-binding transcription factor n=1 Tax=Nonomuraea sp. NPDC059022 TaxID=3346705 RepID=UPI0036BA368F